MWKYAKTPMNEYIEKFIYTLQPLISALLLGHRYTDIKDLLDKTRNIEDMKKDIVVNFPKLERFTTLKSNQGSKKSIKESAKGFAGSVGSAAESTNIKKGSTGANWDCVHLNSKFGPISTKSEKWIET